MIYLIYQAITIIVISFHIFQYPIEELKKIEEER